MSERERYVGAVDQGTTSTRFIIFNSNGESVGSHQLEHHQIYPRPGWVEHDPAEIWSRTDAVIRLALKQAGISGDSLAAIGITNQRETTVVWDRTTGEALHNAIVWQDTRTARIVEELASRGGIDRLRDLTGLPLATYFAGPKIQWLLENCDEVASAAQKGDAVFGTIDSWLLWNLAGGVDGGVPGGVHVTDTTNASRTLLMDLNTREWSADALDLLGIPQGLLPEIQPSIHSKTYCYTRSDGPVGAAVPITGVLGDQQAALFGQACFDKGGSKNTYGTGCFFLMNTGTEVVHSNAGLLTTVAFSRDDTPPHYALEGSIAVAGALVQWLRDNLGLIERSADIELLASQVADSGGVYFVPAFSGLFAPHWRPDARGIIAGLTGFATAGHVARAVLESTAFQTFDIVEAMKKDSHADMASLKVDGGMVGNDILMQFQSDILGIPVVRPRVAETTALGAAYAAGLAVGFWDSLDDLKSHWFEDRRWSPKMSNPDRADRIRFWRRAVERSFGWIED